MTTALLALLACSGLNRARGDDRWMPDWMPGRALFPVSIAIGLIGACFGGLWYGAAFGAAFLVWGAPAWGYLQLLGRPVLGKGPSRVEAALLRVAGGRGHVALMLRHSFAVPLLLPFGILPVAFPVAAAAAYEAAWRIRPSNPIWIAELIVGALWGVLIVCLA